VQSFKAPKKSLGDIDADALAAVITAAADIAFVVEGRGVIQDAAISRAELGSDLSSSAGWIGSFFADLFTEESRPKSRLIFEDAASAKPPRWRQLNHRADVGADIPILYSAVKLDAKDRFIVVGRDMRGLASLQQRLISAQISMERDYSRLRHAETRYRVLFQTSSEPVLVIDGTSDRIAEANPAAQRLFGECTGRLIGQNFSMGLDAPSVQALKSWMTATRAGLAVEDNFRVRITDSADEFEVQTTMFRQGAGAYYLMRFAPVWPGMALAPSASAQSKLLSLVRKSNDGLVVVDRDSRILSANAAFLQMIQLVNEDQARRELLDRWLGRSSVDVGVLVANVRQHGSVTLFATLLRGEHGATTNVEISAVVLDDGDHPDIGLAIRNVERRISQSPSETIASPKSVEQLKELIGRVTLKDMVRESTDLIERLCIEAALELTGDNRASAAEMLGLSRQSLYVKLRRYGLAEPVESEG
jgi:transcriptional regulator PpsR